MKVLRHILLITLIGSTLHAESWYSPYLQKIRSYFNPTTISYATVGAAAGGYVAHRADWNPCVGAACGLLLGLSAEKLSNLYANMRKFNQRQISQAHLSAIQRPLAKNSYAQLSNIPIARRTQVNPEQHTKFIEIPLNDYEIIKQKVFNKMGQEFEDNFNRKYQRPTNKRPTNKRPTIYALIVLASHFDAMPTWKETIPLQATVTINSEKIPLSGDIADILYNNQMGIISYRNSFLE